MGSWLADWVAGRLAWQAVGPYPSSPALEISVPQFPTAFAFASATTLNILSASSTFLKMWRYFEHCQGRGVPLCASVCVTDLLCIYIGKRRGMF